MNSDNQNDNLANSIFYDQMSSSYEHPFSSTFENIKRTTLSLSAINVQITRSHTLKSSQATTEVIQSLQVPQSIDTSTFQLNHLIKIIQLEGNYQFQGCIIMLYFVDGELYVNFGIYPFTNQVVIDLEEYIQNSTQTIKLKAERTTWKIPHIEMFKNMSQMLQQGPPTQIVYDENEGQWKKAVEKKQKVRRNFQKIGYIVKKILTLKSSNKYKNRVKIQNFRLKNERIFSNKSQQDYFTQIRKGYKYHYDFNENCEQNMWHLRKFVREKDIEKRRKQLQEEGINSQILNKALPNHFQNNNTD